MNQTDLNERVIARWRDNLEDSLRGSRKMENFWDSHIARRIQQLIAFPDCDSPGLEIPAAARLLKSHIELRKLDRGLSVGCGTAHKEVLLLEMGLVEHITLLDISSDMLSVARQQVENAGLSNRVSFVCQDFADVELSGFDLIYFDNSLHHLQNVDLIISSVVAMLNKDGIFLMDDFVGSTYHQFSNQVLNYAQHIRSIFPESFFVDGVPREICRSTVDDWICSDPSEACDSGNILPAIARRMSGARIIPTGGIIYYLACRDIFHKFCKESVKDYSTIQLLFELDRVVTRANPNLTCYALALWQKDSDGSSAKDWKDLIHWPLWQMPS